MNSTKNEEQGREDALKALRNSRRQSIEGVVRMMKKQKKAIDAIREQLKVCAKTVPELAETTGLESSQVMWYVATLKKYGMVAEGEKDGNYFRYQLAETTE